MPQRSPILDTSRLGAQPEPQAYGVLAHSSLLVTAKSGRELRPSPALSQLGPMISVKQQNSQNISPKGGLG